MTPFDSFAGTRCMNRWDEGSWDTDPHRHGRFTIIVDRGHRLYIRTSRMLGLPYPLKTILHEMRGLFIPNWLCLANNDEVEMFVKVRYFLILGLDIIGRSKE